MAETNLERQAREVAEQETLADGDTAYRLIEDATSPYSAKVRAYLHFKELRYRRMRATFPLYMRTIAEQVGFPTLPVLWTPEGDVLTDSTPLLRWLEARHPAPRALPEDPRVLFLSELVEDFADEYMPRFSMHYRWGNAISRETLSHRIARRLAYGTPVDPRDLAPGVLARQSGFDVHLGLDEATRSDVDAQFGELLGILDALLERQSFLLGERPSPADFAVYGQLWAHSYRDPFSMHLLELHGPRTCTWLDELTDIGDARGAVGRTAFGDHGPFDVAAERLAPLLRMVASTWVPVGAASAAASVERRKQIELSIRGVPTTMSTNHYRAYAFEEVQRCFDGLDPDARADVSRALSAAGDFRPLLDGPRLHNGLYDGLGPPLVRDGIGDNRVKHRKQKSG